MKIQRYVSDELTHFVGRKYEHEQQYKLLVSILTEGVLGIAQKPLVGYLSKKPFSSNEAFISNVTCFCDIPQEDMQLHMAKYSRFGLAFTKTFMLEHGAMLVFYIPRKSKIDRDSKEQTASECFDKQSKNMIELFCKIMKIQSGILSPESLQSIYMNFSGFISSYIFCFCKFFDVGLDDTDPENYYMEREWRLLGHMEFSLSDVTRVILPLEYSKRFRNDIPDYFGQTTFS